MIRHSDRGVVFGNTKQNQDGKIETLVYYFGNEIYNYQDELIMRLDLSEQEYIYEISYAESGEQLKIEIANVATDEGRRVEVVEL